ncbi:hypothetical protein DFJ58DRAFT_842443 [Suillus subalutaceus]|uniref:uncharacterized protein n=1 Tax=Suillus subalutaceus TaxID=48586 RepID=UPI001B861D0A|nr:uncharacterized protein DFJ58DRAFT_842443 [Suillus subalutaceus]KAG1850368.1 hypothetical protein DFJ58DRAFT_842443 [Suillus subalutaceus]
MSDWYVSFEEILAEHKEDFLEANNPQSTHCRQILREVRDEIVELHKLQDDPVDVPKALKRAIRRHYVQFIEDEEDRRAEEELLRDVREEDQPGVSLEEREANARPKDASFYKKKLTDWDVALKLFKQEINDYDKDEQQKMGVPHSIKYRTGHARQWFNHMISAQQNEVQQARDKWNEEGAPAESQAIHKKAPEMSLSVSIHESEPLMCKRHLQSVHEEIRNGRPMASKNFQSGQRRNFYILMYPTQLDPADNDDDDDNDEDEDKDVKPPLPEVVLDKDGFAKLPSRTGVTLNGQQELVRQIFHASYSVSFVEVFTGSIKPVPWGVISADPATYIDLDCVPKDFVFRDPSHMSISCLRKGLPSIQSSPADSLASNTSAGGRSTKHMERPADDKTFNASASPRPTKRMKRPAEESDSSDDDEAGWLARPSLAQHGAPAAVPMKDRMKFLRDLSSNDEYRHFIEGIRDLKKDQTSEHSEGWPTWAMWSWERSYLPNTMHSLDRELQESLEIIKAAKISGSMSAMRVALGLGMLLRECKRAIEYEADEATPDIPSYISTSTLDTTCLDLVIDALNKARGVVVRMSKVRAVPQVEEPAHQEGSEPGNTAKTTADRGEVILVDLVDKSNHEETEEEVEIRWELEWEMQLLDEQRKKMVMMTETVRMLHEEKEKLEKENRVLEKEIVDQQMEQVEEGQEAVGDEVEQGDDKQKEVDEEEQEVEQRGKSRGGTKDASWGDHKLFPNPRPGLTIFADLPDLDFPPTRPCIFDFE